ncbi:hypothetical protein R1flu_004104 [Riccia fluitans]|uniref:Uncharacterized protein n=1 Tax=Riccia fluitans TaxID=41844 RepID=A0ABD1YPQ0_9MARC
MFCKYIRNCKLAWQYLSYSSTISIYVGTLDNPPLALHEERYTSYLNKFRVLSQVFNDMEKEDLYIVNDLKGIGEMRTHLHCTPIEDVLRMLTAGATMTTVTQASKRYIRLG